MQLSYSRLIFYLAAIFITSSISSGATDHKKQPRMAASTAGGDSRIFDIKSNSAQEGVNLLEQIMQKMHNMPQIALNNTRQTIVLKSPLLADNALPGMSSYDYLKNAQEQSLPVAGPMSNASAHVAEMQSTAQGFKQVRGNLLHQPDRKNFNQYPEATGTATARQGTLLAKKTEISQASAHSFDPNNPAPRLQGASSASIGPREYQIVDQRPVVRDFRVARDAFSAPGTIIGSLAGRNGMSTAVGAGAVMGGVYGTTASVFHAKHSVKERATLPTNNLDIALSPPAVITGIPLIRLGSSEKEVSAAIGALGKLHRDLFHGWSVWSLQKAKRSDYSIQVFMRHGIVDAVRVFDKSFLRSDF